MRVETLLEPTAEPVALARAKLQARIDHADDDVLLTEQIIPDARRYIEGWTHRVLVRATVRVYWDRFPAHHLTLPVSPVRKVSSVKYVDTAGTEQTFAAASWQFDIRGHTPRVKWAPGETWPNTESDRLNAVIVEFIAGYATPFTSTFGTDTLNATAHPFANDDVMQVWSDGNDLPAGLSPRTNYYVVGAAADTFQLSLTSGGSAVTLTDDGTGAHFAGNIEGAIMSALQLLIAHLYEHREENAPITLNELPLGIKRLLMPYTTVRF